MLPPGEEIFKLAAKSAMQNIRDSQDTQKDIPEILLLSLMYQVLAQESAFIGIMQQFEKHRGELKLVRIPAISINEPSVVYQSKFCSLKSSRTSNIGNDQSRRLKRNQVQLMSAMECSSSIADMKTLKKPNRLRNANKKRVIMQSHLDQDSESYALQMSSKRSLKQSQSSQSSMISQKNTSSNFQNAHKNEKKEELKQKSSAAISRPQSAALSQKPEKIVSKLDSLINGQSSAGNWNSAMMILKEILHN
ncbi:UNKNOWN [Stylonychia lemnae]|uniref:Uncharacterized protein n=1 Tax=Stylonychia lemnae TaxID=5949 RepID=A0A077ZXE4_STYLE|nr:UNKNOWN [Stylonychia lemnae]|eukprot:CDW73221.1 UNKNOWN [Stylonychia lemnae]